MKIIHYLKENYKKIIGLTILAIISSALTCLLLWPGSAPVNASATDTHSMVEEIVKNEVERYIEEKGDVITRDDLISMTDRINNALNDNGLGMRTQNQAAELDKIVQSCIERVLAGDRNAADSAAKDIAMLIKRISDNDKAYAELVNSYNSYQTEMTGKIKNLSDEAARLAAMKADKQTAEKESRETIQQINTVEKIIESVSEYTKEFEKETQEKLSGIDISILTNQEKFSEFINTYNEYRSDINDILDSKAGKNDVESLRSKADALEERMSGINKALESKTCALESKTGALESKAGALENRISGIDNTLDSKAGKDDVESLKTKTGSLEDRLSSVTSNLAGKKLWVGTQAEYNAIASKDPNTLYFIK